MPWKTKSIDDLPRDVRLRLSDSLQEIFLEAYLQAKDQKQDESDCLRAGWTAAVSQNARIVHSTFLFQPGDWDSAGGDGKITEKNVDDAIFAMNRCEEMGVPIGLKYQHSDAANAVPVGIVKNVKKKDEYKAYGDLYIYQDAKADRDGKGPRVLATIDQMADALLTDGMKVSIEAYRDVKVQSYYGDREISMEPSALAILPTGVAPAVVENIVAGRDRGKLFAFMVGETEEGNEDMTLEELIELVNGLVSRIEALEEKLSDEEEEETSEDQEEKGEKEEDSREDDDTVAKLRDTIQKQQDKLKELQDEKLQKDVDGLLASVKTKLTYGEVEKLEDELKDEADLSARKVVLERLNSVLEAIPEPQRQMRSGRKVKKEEDEFNRKVDERIERTGEDRFTAARAVLETMDDSDFETVEVKVT